MKYVLYQKPSDKNTISHEYWTKYGTPFTDETEAHNSVPDSDSQLSEMYMYKVITFPDANSIPDSLTDSEARQIQKSIQM